MPRNVRNFFFDLDVDGHSRIATGPQSRGGGADLTIKMRHDGAVVPVADVLCRAAADGTLSLTIRPLPLSARHALQARGLSVTVDPSDGEITIAGRR